MFLFLQKNQNLQKILQKEYFLQVKFDKSCCVFVLQNRRSQSVCFILVEFHFTYAWQPVPKIVSLGREASISSLTRKSSCS